MKLIYIFSTGLASMMLLGCPHGNSFSTQIEASATANAPWAVGEVVATSCMVPSGNADARRYKAEKDVIYYGSNPFIFNDRDAFWRYIQMFKIRCQVVQRKFKGITTQGNYLVKDYLAATQMPLGAAYIFHRQEDVKQSAFKTEWLSDSESTKHADSSDGTKYYKDGMRIGPWETYDSSGIAGPQKCKGEYGVSSGEREGLWTCWIKNGMMVTQGQYLQGKMHGRWTAWRSQETVYTQGLYIDGEKQGWWIETAPGEYRTQGYYQNNLREGVWVTFDYDGGIQTEGSYIHGLKDGCWSWFLAGKKYQQGCFSKGHRIGLWQRWYNNGQLEMQGEYDGQENPIGQWRSWNHDGSSNCAGMQCRYYFDD